MINIGIGVSWAKALYSVANNIIANFRARVLSYPNSIFEAGPCLDATLEELNAIGLLDNASLIVTPNAYNEGVLYDVIPNTTLGDMDVVRATTATRVNSAGLIEVVPRNLLTYSNNFSNVNWSKVNSTITANQVGYDGTNNASLLVENTATDAHRIQQTPSLQGQTTISVYAKANTRNWLYLRGVQAGSAVVGWFNLSNGTLGTVNTNGTGSITSIGNGWYRCSLTIANFASGFEVYIGLSNADNVTSYLGNGSSIFIQNAQVESFPTATEYFPTTTRLNIPRIDYTNGSCPSLLVEPQRTNLNLYSEDFGNAYWTLFQATRTLNVANSPSGIQNADKLIEDNTNDFHSIYLSSNFTVTVGQAYTRTIYAKADGRNWISLLIVDGSQYRAFFDLQNGVIGNISAGVTAKITNAGNGWYRCEITRVAATVSLSSMAIELAISNGTVGYLGNGTSGVYLWGAQLELGSYATSYIPTVASSVTRNADLISKTGVSSLIGTEFTLFFDGFESDGGSSSRYIVLKGSGGFYANLIIIEQTPTNLIAAFINDSSSASVFASYSGQLIAGQRVKLALRCKNNDFAFYVNGQLRNAQTSGTVPTTSSLYLGFYTDYADNYNKINSAIIFNTALTDEQCTLITGDSYNSYAEMANSLNYILE